MNTSQQPTIGQRLLQERKSRSWSQQMLADKIGTTILNINRWEHDKTQPQPYYREKLCEVFGKSHDELFGEPEEEEHAPIWNIPHLHNLYFTGREEILTRLHDALTTTTKKAIAITQPHAISGLGGIGKTQTAVEYAYRYSDEYKVILWARADTHEALVSELVSLATLLELPEKNEADQNKVVAAVMRWLQNTKGWLLIFDNADDIEMVSEFLPTRGAGHTLLTTRSQATGKNIKGVEIEKMEREEGALLLLRRAKIIPEDATLDQASEAHRKDAEAICELMDGLPLALDQAAAYIEENECSLQDYLTLYQTRRIALLKRRGTFSKRDYPKPVATTWSLSFEQVQQNTPAAADLLRLCAFLHPDAIPEEMITAGAPELGPILQPVAEDPIQLAETIGELRKYSLVRRNPGTKTLTLHRLVQTVLSDGMEKEMQREWAERAVKVVNRAFPQVEFARWPQCQRYVPHTQVSAELIEQWEMALPEAAQLLSRAGNYLRDRAQYLEAESLLQRAYSIREQLLGEDQPDVAESLHHLAWLCRLQGRYEQAETLYQRALAVREKSLGAEHAETASTLNDLALLYWEQGKYVQAEPLYLRSLAIEEKVYGPDHPEVATTLNNLGLLYTDRGKYAQAEGLLQRALVLWEQALGPAHPDVTMALCNLAWLYYKQGLYAQAEPLARRSLTLSEKTLGPEHVDVAYDLDHLALLYTDQGNYAQAEPLFQRALAIRERTLGPEHPLVGRTLHLLAQLYYTQGNYAQAEPLLTRSLVIREQALGPDHPEVADSLNTLALLSLTQGESAQAEFLAQRALAIYEQALEPDHPDVATSLNTLAQIYLAKHKWVQAEPLLLRALAIREQVLVPEHPITAASLNNLGYLYYSQGKYEQAEPLFQRALSILEKSPGPTHPDVTTPLEHYAALLRKTNRQAEAAELEKRAQNIRARRGEK